jgi:hypothetical protein
MFCYEPSRCVLQYDKVIYSVKNKQHIFNYWCCANLDLVFPYL